MTEGTIFLKMASETIANLKKFPGGGGTCSQDPPHVLHTKSEVMGKTSIVEVQVKIKY